MTSTDEKPSSMRFSDIGKPPKRMLAPIDGFERKPLVSLEEAVEPLADLVPNIERNAFVVKENCHHPKDGLTSDESAAIMLYTFESEPSEESLYAILNTTLRSEQRSKLRPWFLYLRLIMNGLEKLPSSNKQVLFRGVRLDLRDEFSTGTSFIWWAFSSCTSKIEVLESEQFLGKHGTRTLFQITSSSGKDIKNHSFIPNEHEILLIPARQFKVTGCLSPGNGFHIINLEEIEMKFKLLGSIPKPSVNITPPVIHKQKLYKKSLPNIPPNARWSSERVVVIKDLKNPKGIDIDPRDGTVYVAVFDPKCVIAWTPGDTEYRTIIPLDVSPTDVCLDHMTNSLFVASSDVVRVQLESENKQGEDITTDIKCWGVTMDDAGNVYVTDHVRGEVKCFTQDSKIGEVVAGGNGKGGGLHQLQNPLYVAVDSEGSIYTSDQNNNRIVKWKRGEKEGVVVGGFDGQGSSNTQLSSPYGIFLDANDNLYVADSLNRRIVRYRKNERTSETIVQGSLGFVYGLSFDYHNNMYVSDDSGRVLRFDFKE